MVSSAVFHWATMVGADFSIASFKTHLARLTVGCSKFGSPRQKPGPTSWLSNHPTNVYVTARATTILTACAAADATSSYTTTHAAATAATATKLQQVVSMKVHIQIKTSFTQDIKFIVQTAATQLAPAKPGRGSKQLAVILYIYLP